MSSITPKPIIAQVVQTWDVPPGMKIALVVDIQSRFWVVESCPAGTHFWTLAQAQMLPQSGRTGIALRTAVTVAHKLQAMETVTDIAMACEAQGIAPKAITSLVSASSICNEPVGNEGVAAEQALSKSEVTASAAIALEFNAEKARPMTAHSLSNSLSNSLSLARKQGALNARLPRRQATERGDRSEGMRPIRQSSARNSRRADAVLARATVR